MGRIKMLTKLAKQLGMIKLNLVALKRMLGIKGEAIDTNLGLEDCR